MADEIIFENSISNYSDVVNPEITPFATNQNTHINFASEEFIITSNDSASFGSQLQFELPRKQIHSLITNLKLEFSLPAISTSDVTGARWINWVNSIGHALIENIKLEASNTKLDEHTGEFMEIWNELSVPQGDNYNTSIGKYKGAPPRNSTSIPAKKITVQLLFWFCRGAPGRDSLDATKLAFPIGYTNQDTITLTLKINALNKLLYTDGTISSPSISLTDCKLIAEYTFLDLSRAEEELAMVSRNFYSNYTQQINFVQKITFTGTATAAGTKDINLNSLESSITELLWFVQKTRTAGSSRQHRFKFSYHAGDILDKCSVMIGDYSLSGNLDVNNFTTNNPLAVGHLVPKKKVHVYSFALQPTIYSNPSGFFNLSNITGVKVRLTFSDFTGSYEGELYALGRKILIINNGICTTRDIA